MLTFLHGADFHLDSPFRALSPEQAAQRRQEQRQLLYRMADLAQDAEVDLLLLPGDLFDSQRVRPETLEILYDVFDSLDSVVFLAPGNHDPYTDRSPYRTAQWPDNVHIFSQEDPERVALPALDVVVYGSAFTSSHRLGSPLENFQAQKEDLVKVGCFHGDPSSPNSRYGPVSYEDIAGSGLDYLALGHIHSASGLKRVGNSFYAWPGCPEGRGFDETGDKGVYLGQIEDGRVSLDFVPLAHRRYLAPKLDITGKDPRQVLEAYFAQADSKDIVRLILTGEREEGNEPDLTALTALASSHFYSAQLYDNTILAAALWARMEEDTLTGLFLQSMYQRLTQASPAQRPPLERAVRFGLAALEGREEPR